MPVVVHSYAQILAAGLTQLGHTVVSECYFDTLVIYVPDRAKSFADSANNVAINFRLIDNDHLGISLDETTTRDNLRAVWHVFAGTTAIPDINLLNENIMERIPERLLRNDEILQHPVFDRYH